MAANTRMATAVQILCVIAYKGPDGTNAAIISKSLRTNPVVVRRLLKCLEQQDLVELRPGKDGGVQLKRDPGRITLDEIHRAVETDVGVFALRPKGNPKCPVDRQMNHLLGPIFASADSAVEKTLKKTTLSSLVKSIP
jgi:Rrf2 family protein